MMTEGSQETASRGEGLQKVLLRNQFYRRSFHYMLGFCFLVLFFDILLGVVIAWLLSHQMQPLYFPADSAGRLIREVPLNEANLPDQAVSDWVIRAVNTAYSYDFINYHAQMQNAQQYFSTAGWSQYMKGLERSSNLLALTQRKLIVTSQVVGPPKLIKKGLLPSQRLAWKFEIPILMRYQMPPFDGKTDISNPLLVTALVWRENVLQGDDGLGIIQLNAFAAS